VNKNANPCGLAFLFMAPGIFLYAW
jgi:hypothetical protein